MAHNTKARAAELLTAGLDIVTPDVQAELDKMNAESRDAERAQAYRDLERKLRETTGCSHPTSRQYIAKACRLRRGEIVEADRRGGFNPANAGDNNWKRRHNNN